MKLKIWVFSEKQDGFHDFFFKTANRSKNVVECVSIGISAWKSPFFPD